MFGNICSYTPHCVEKVPKMLKNGKKSQNKVTIFVITLINFLKTLSMTIDFILVYVNVTYKPSTIPAYCVENAAKCVLKYKKNHTWNIMR